MAQAIHGQRGPIGPPARASVGIDNVVVGSLTVQMLRSLFIDSCDEPLCRLARRHLGTAGLPGRGRR